MILIPLAFFHDEQQKRLKSWVESQQKTEPWMDEFANIDQSDFESLVYKSKAEKFRILEHSCSDWFVNDFGRCGVDGNDECIEIFEYDKRRDMCFYSLISEKWDYWDDCRILYSNYVTQEERSSINVDVVFEGSNYDYYFNKIYCQNDLEFIENKRLEYNKAEHDFDEDTFNQMIDDVVQSRIESGCITMEKTGTGELICVSPSIVPKIIEMDFAQISDEIIKYKACVGKGWPDDPVFRCYQTYDEIRSSAVCNDPDETCVYAYRDFQRDRASIKHKVSGFIVQNIGCEYEYESRSETCRLVEPRPYCMMYQEKNNEYPPYPKICYKNEKELNFFDCNIEKGTCYFKHENRKFNLGDGSYYQSSDGCAISTNPDECKVFEKQKTLTNYMR